MADLHSEPVDPGKALLLQRLEQLAEQSEVIVPALAATLEELPPSRKKQRFQRLVSQLQAGATPQDLYRREDADLWLPLLGGTTPLRPDRFLGTLMKESSRSVSYQLQNMRMIAYPLAVLALALAVVVFLSVVIVPVFNELYDDFGLALPAMTKMTLTLSRAIRNLPLLSLGVLTLVMASGYGLLYVFRHLQNSNYLIGALTNGSTPQVSAMAEFLGFLVCGLRNELPLATALRAAGDCTSTTWLKREANLLAHQIDRSRTKSGVWKTKLPHTVAYALVGGPDRSPNVPLLESIADIYWERVDTRFSWTAGIMPMIAICFLGGVILFVVLSLYLPLVSPN